MPDSSISVANEFLKHWRVGAAPAQMKLQKLVYIAHGWHLAIQGTPLIEDEFPQAWDNGPVFRNLWDAIRLNGYSLSLTEPAQVNDRSGNPPQSKLSPNEHKLIEAVWQRYGRYSARELSDMTHMPGTPWTNAYLSVGQNAPIKDPEIRRHYRLLGQAAQSQ